MQQMQQYDVQLKSKLIAQAQPKILIYMSLVSRTLKFRN